MGWTPHPAPASKCELKLERGEALFEVAKDATRPFVMAAGGQQVVAVGTAFVVKLLPGGAEPMSVTVLEGEVAVAPREVPATELAAKRGATAGLMPGQRAHAHPGARRRVERGPPRSSHTAGRGVDRLAARRGDARQRSAGRGHCRDKPRQPGTARPGRTAAERPARQWCLPCRRQRCLRARWPTVHGLQVQRSERGIQLAGRAETSGAVPPVASPPAPRKLARPGRYRSARRVWRCGSTGDGPSSQQAPRHRAHWQARQRDHFVHPHPHRQRRR
jgi:hypothetical protein